MSQSHSVPSPDRTALIVVDAQESFRHRPYFRADDFDRYLAAQNALIAGFVALGLPVVRVLHVEDEGAFSLASGYVRPVTGLVAFDETLRFEKHMHSAFAGTPLAQWLLGQRITRIAVSGIRTEQCCETTTRDGSDRGYRVDYVSEATATFAMDHANGRHFTPAEIRERTELVLADRFATIVTVEAALARAREAAQPRTTHAAAA
jgi:nicotinamidase-related amidase